MNDQLARIREDLDNGRHVPPVSTREFLSWFSAQRRGSWVVWWIRRSLKEAGLETVPDFASTYIDAQIELKRAPEEESEAALSLASEAEDELTAPSQAVVAPITVLASKDPTYRLSKLAAANRGVVSVKPDASIAECITKMLLRDFSQLPVMTNDRDVKGTVSWKTIGYEQTRSKACFAREVMVPHHEIRASSSIFEAIPLIVAHEYVLVRNDENLITGIITAADLSQQFHLLAEPFLLLSEIENLLRNIIGDCFSSAELSDARDPSETDRKVDAPADLNFGEYVRLLQNSGRWRQLGLEIDRATFCKDLDAIREIRNTVMHFDPEGIVDEELNKLRTFTSFLKEIQRVLDRNRATIKPQ